MILAVVRDLQWRRKRCLERGSSHLVRGYTVDAFRARYGGAHSMAMVGRSSGAVS